MKITTKIAREFLRNRLDDLYYAPNDDLPVPVPSDLYEQYTTRMGEIKN